MTNTEERIYALNLQSFAEGGADGTGAEGGQAGSGFAAANGSNQGVAVPQENGQQGAPVQQIDEAAVSRYLDEHKDFAEKHFKGQLDKRMKSTKATVEKYNKLAPLVGMLNSKYGVAPDDIEGLQRAIENDNSYWEAIAYEKGISVDEAKNMAKILGENAQLRAWKQEQQQLMQEEQAERIMQDWNRQEAELKKIVPNFDLNTELQNETFYQIVKSGMSLEAAYMACHYREHMSEVAEHTAKTVEGKLANKIASGAGRPVEGAAGNQSTSVKSIDVSSMSDQEIKQLFDRGLKGERIIFN